MAEIETAIAALWGVGFGRVIPFWIHLVETRSSADAESDRTKGSDAVDPERSKSGNFQSFIEVRNKHSGLWQIHS